MTIPNPRISNLLLIFVALIAVTLSLRAQERTIVPLTGPSDAHCSVDGTGEAARFASASNLTVDDHGNVYVTESRTIRKITPAGRAMTLAGLAGSTDSIVDGVGSSARLFNPSCITVGQDGMIYFCDGNGATIRKVSPSGRVTTLAGVMGVQGRSDGAGSAASFEFASDIFAGLDGNVYVTDYWADTIRKVTPAGVVTTLHTPPPVDPRRACLVKFPPLSVHFENIFDEICDGSGNIYLAGYANHRGTINRISPQGVVTELAGVVAYKLAFGNNGVLYGVNYHNVIAISREGVATTLAGVFPVEVSRDGPLAEAGLARTAGVTIDRGGVLYVSDGRLIRKISPAGYVSTIAGQGSSFVDGPGNMTSIGYYCGLAVDAAGTLYLADQYNRAIRKITSDGMVSTIAGSPNYDAGSIDGPGPLARFDTPYAIAVASDGTLYVADSGNHTIRRVSAAGDVTTIAGVAGFSGSADGRGSTARFNSPQGVAVDAFGSIYISDTENQTIRKIAADGTVSTIAGLAGVSGNTDGLGSSARFSAPRELVFDTSGNLYITDYESIRRMDPSGAVTTVAGSGGFGFADGTGREADFVAITGITIDASGTLYIADLWRIRLGLPALADAARFGQTITVNSDVTLQFDTSARTADKWEWTVTRRPADSVAEFSAPTTRNPTFRPDVPGLFQFKLIASNGLATRISTLQFESHVVVPVRRHAAGH